MSQFLSDIIGDKYKNWEKGDRIYLSTPTGSGKTYFILNVLLPYARLNNKKILYFVNRKILKKQIDEDLNSIAQDYIVDYHDYGLKDSICITTYQKFEQDFVENGKVTDFYRHYDIIVADECHYFSHDATFNTRTFISFEWLDVIKHNAIQIFASATINQFKEFEEHWRILKAKSNPQLPTSSYNRLHHKQLGAPCNEYKGVRDYTYLDISFFDDIEQIEELWNLNKKSKWLIFYNDIKAGKKLKEELKNKKLGAVFIDASFADDDESKKEVEKIIESGKYDADILIATSALDNGVNIKDRDLRNIIIIADNEIEFIQMLGRRRVLNDNDKIKLFLPTGKIKSFKQRLENNNKLYNTFQECRTHFGDSGYFNKRMFDDKSFQEDARKILFYLENQSNMRLYVDPNTKNWCFIPNWQQSLKYDSYGRNISYNMYSPTEVIFIPNLIVGFDIAYRNKQYREIIEELEKDSDAFKNKQLEWLGFDKEATNNVIVSDKNANIQKLKDEIISVIDSCVDKELEKEEYGNIIEQIKKSMKQLIEICDDGTLSKNDKEELSKISKDRPLSRKRYETYNQYMNLPFTLAEKSNSKIHIFNKISE